MKPILLLLFLCSSVPLMAQHGLSTFGQVQHGAQTQAIQAGISIWADYSVSDILSIELVQDRELKRKDCRINILELGYSTKTTEHFGFRCGLYPVAAFGNITGSGYGLKGQLAFRYTPSDLEFSYYLGFYSSYIHGKENPWNGDRNTKEFGVFFRVASPW